MELVLKEAQQSEQEEPEVAVTVAPLEVVEVERRSVETAWVVPGFARWPVAAPLSKQAPAVQKVQMDPIASELA
jgi:hypothetical protein